MEKELLTYMQLFLSFGNACILLYAFKKFLGKPQDSINSRLTKLEYDTAEIKNSLRLGNDNFRNQRELNEVLIRSTFAILEFEVHYCETEQKPISKNLERAKDELHDYFATGRNKTN